MRFSPSEPSSSPTYRHAANDAIATTALKAEKYKNCTGWRKFISYHTDRSSSVIWIPNCSMVNRCVLVFFINKHQPSSYYMIFYTIPANVCLLSPTTVIVGEYWNVVAWCWVGIHKAGPCVFIQTCRMKMWCCYNVPQITNHVFKGIT